MRTARLLPPLLISFALLACGSSASSTGAGGSTGSGGNTGTGGNAGTSSSASGAGDTCPLPDGGVAASCDNAECIGSRDCCQGLYCSCINADTCDTAAHCTATPACAILGASCATKADCCEPDGTACEGSAGATRCCIDPAAQKAHPETLRCYCSADCCAGSTCDVATGDCQ